jgi:hypothetical protein
MRSHTRIGLGTIPGKMKTCVCIAAFVVVACGWVMGHLRCLSAGSFIALEVLRSETVYAQEVVEPRPMQTSGSEDWRKTPPGSQNTWANAAGGFLFMAVLFLFAVGVDRLQRRHRLSTVQNGMRCPNTNQESMFAAEVVPGPDSKEQSRSCVMWYYSQDGERVTGPVSASVIRGLIGSGTLRRGHFLSNDGHQWYRAETLKGVNWP